MTVGKKTDIVIERVPIGDLRPDPFNPRRIAEAEMESLTRSIHSFLRSVDVSLNAV